jgi:hypothetical protein
MNERDYPHVVEPALPPGGFRPSCDEMRALHRELIASGALRAARARPQFGEGCELFHDRQREIGGS